MPPVNPPRGSASDSSAAQVAGGTGFSLTGFMSDLAEQNKLRDARQAEQLATAEEQRNIMQDSTRLARQQADSMSFLKQDFDIARQKTVHARELEDGGLFDNLRLAGLQMLDPAGYDPEQRTKRLQEDSAQAALLSQYYGYQQTALQSKLAGSTANLDYLKQLEAIGHEKLTAFADSAALLHQNLSAAQGMKDDATMNLSREQIDAAIEQAKKAPTKTVNIGGIDVDLGSLTDRQTALYDRESANLTKKAGLALAKDDASHVDDVLANRETQRMIDQNTREHAGTSILIQNAQQTDLARRLVEDGQARDLRTRNLKEIQILRDNNYKSPAGEQYDPAAVENVYRIKKQAETDQINDQLNQNMLKSFDLKQVADERSRVQASLPKYPVGSPIATAAQEYYNALGVTATGIGPENGLVTRITAMQGFAAAKEKFDKTLQAQATLDGKGDKNLAELKLEWYRGNPIPQETLTNAAVERLSKFKSVADLFPPEIAPKIEKKYRELVQQSQQRNPWNASMTESDKKIAQAEAAQNAIDWGVNQGLQGSSDGIVANQVLDPSHPLYRRQTPTQFATSVLQADMAARKQWQEQNGLSDAEATQVDSGIAVTGKPDLNTLIASRKQLENVNLLQVMDGIEPGLGHQVAEWWSTKGPDYISNIGGTISQSTNGSFQGTNFTSQASKTLSDSFSQYATMLQQADSAYQQEFAKRNADLLTFNNSPENAQIAVLSQTPGITDNDRKQIFSTVIRPLLDQAAAKKLDFDQTNQYVESQIQNYVPQTPMMKELMRITRKDRPQVLENLNSWKSMFSRFINFSGTDLPNHPESVSWYQGLRQDAAKDSKKRVPGPYGYGG